MATTFFKLRIVKCFDVNIAQSTTYNHKSGLDSVVWTAYLGHTYIIITIKLMKNHGLFRCHGQVCQNTTCCSKSIINKYKLHVLLQPRGNSHRFHCYCFKSWLQQYPVSRSIFCGPHTVYPYVHKYIQDIFCLISQT